MCAQVGLYKPCGDLYIHTPNRPPPCAQAGPCPPRCALRVPRESSLIWLEVHHPGAAPVQPVTLSFLKGAGRGRHEIFYKSHDWSARVYFRDI